MTYSASGIVNSVICKALVLAFIAFSAAAADAQSVSKVLGKANKALGGEKQLKAARSQQRTGDVTRLSDGATGSYRSMASTGGQYTEAFDLAGFEISLGHNGKSGWARDSKMGGRTLTGDIARDFQAEAIYRNTRWLNAKDEKAKLTPGGNTMLNGRPASIVIMTTAKGAKLKLYFDSDTGLLIREEFPHGAGTRWFEYSDHRAVNGIQTPLSMRFSYYGEDYSVKLESAAYNQTIAGSNFDFPVVSMDPLPDIPKLLKEMKANADKVDGILENYSYTELRIERDLKNNGDLVEKSSEKRSLTFYKGHRITRTIEKNGKPLSASDQAKEDREAEKQVADIEKRIAERERKELAQREKGTGGGESSGEGQRIQIADALRGSRLVNPRRERFSGRDVIVFDFEPDAAFKPKTRNEKIFAVCNGAVWVDPATSQVVRLEATLIESLGNFLAKAKRGTAFTIENELVNNEIWLPSRADINLQIKILFAGININNLIRYGDYRRFETEVKDAVVGDEKKP